MKPQTISEVAKQAGVNIQTLRYYERRRLLSKPERTASNYRVYPNDTARRIRFIKRVQKLGFSIKEIQEILALRASSRARCADVQRHAQAKIKEIEEKIRALTAMRWTLEKLVAECSAKKPITECSILEAMDSAKEEK